MAMLAGPRRKQKVVNLRAKNSDWSKDNNKFGQRMLEKMGWSTGKGLGANENGIVEHVVARYKNDDKGLGFEDKNDQWTKHDDDFNALLANLSNGSPTEEKFHSGASLEHKSKKSKARVHYHKFTRGKDMSRYSEKDLANIFGKKSLIEIKAEANKPTNLTKEDIKTTEQVFTEKGSMEDYFKNKLAELKSKNIIKINLNNDISSNGDEEADYGFKGFSSNPEDLETLQNESPQIFSFYNNCNNINKEKIIADSIKGNDEYERKNIYNTGNNITENKVQKPKKRKKNKLVDNNTELSEDHSIEKNIQTEEYIKKNKKKSKKVTEINTEHNINTSHIILNTKKSKIKDCVSNEFEDNLEIDLDSEILSSKEKTMVIHDNEESPEQVSVKKPETLESSYIIVKNHVRELHRKVEETKILVEENQSNITLSTKECNKDIKKSKTGHQLSTSISKVSESDIQELRTIYKKCKDVINKIESKYSHLLNVDSLSSKARKSRYLSDAEEECKCILNKKTVFDDNGHGLTQDTEISNHICPKKLKKDVHDSRRENVNKNHMSNELQAENVKVEYEQTIRLPDDLQSLNDILRNPEIDVDFRNQVINKVKSIRQDYSNEIRFNKHLLIEQAKKDPSELFVFNGSNLFDMHGYLLHK